MSLHQCAGDFYFSIEDEDGNFSEGHILATRRQAEAIEDAIVVRMLAMGYRKPNVQMSLGGEYDFAYDEDDDDYEAYAKEIIASGGFVTQNWSTLKEEE